MKPIHALTALATLASGCALLAPTKTAPPGAGDTVKIGVLSSFSGTSAANGPAVRNGVQLAVDRVNAAGGVAGRRLEVLVGDDRSDRTAVAAVANDLIGRGVAAIVGPNSSSITREALLQAAVPKGVPVISPAATSQALTDPSQVDSQGWFFRTVPHDGFQGRVLARKADTAGHTKLAVIHVDSAYGQGLAGSLKAAFEAKTGHTATLVPYPETATPAASYADVVGKALDAAPDAVVLVGYPGEASIMINDWRLAGRGASLRWYFADALQRQSFVANVSDAASLEGQLGTAPATSPTFADAYKAAYGAEPSFAAAAAYDAAALVALAIEAGKSADRTAIRDQLRPVSAEGEAVGPADLAAAIAAVKAGKNVDYEGYAGRVDLDKFGDVTTAAYEIWTIKDKAIVSTGEVLTP
jgi:branched-chain amino acid transport system substrate-binding protein